MRDTSLQGQLEAIERRLIEKYGVWLVDHDYRQVDSYPISFRLYNKRTSMFSKERVWGLGLRDVAWYHWTTYKKEPSALIKIVDELHDLVARLESLQTKHKEALQELQMVGLQLSGGEYRKDET